VAAVRALPGVCDVVDADHADALAGFVVVERIDRVRVGIADFAGRPDDVADADRKAQVQVVAKLRERALERLGQMVGHRPLGASRDDRHLAVLRVKQAGVDALAKRRFEHVPERVGAKRIAVVKGLRLPRANPKDGDDQAGVGDPEPKQRLHVRDRRCVERVLQ